MHVSKYHETVYIAFCPVLIFQPESPDVIGGSGKYIVHILD